MVIDAALLVRQKRPTTIQEEVKPSFGQNSNIYRLLLNTHIDLDTQLFLKYFHLLVFVPGCSQLLRLSSFLLETIIDKRPDHY